MNILSAILYGIIQGITEFLPVSSSGHLALAEILFGFQDAEAYGRAFDILLHLGTLIAVFIVFYKDILELIPAFFTMIKKLFKGKFKLSEYTLNERFVIFAIIATLPLIPASLIDSKVEALSKNIIIVGAILIFNGFVLFMSDSMKSGNKTLENTTVKDTVIVGLCQMFAILPGLSRSGSTITGGLFRGFNREYAVKFSFILSIPAILGANVLAVKDFIEAPEGSIELLPCIVGMVTSAVVGVLAMRLLLYISKKSNFKIFSYYCFAVGLVAIIAGIIK